MEKKFVDGLLVKAPHEKAPDFVKCSLSMKREELINWLSMQDGDWVNVDVKVSQKGKWYAEVNQWKPDQAKPQTPSQAPQPAAAPAGFDDFDDDIPF